MVSHKCSLLQFFSTFIHTICHITKTLVRKISFEPWYSEQKMKSYINLTLKAIFCMSTVYIIQDGFQTLSRKDIFEIWQFSLARVFRVFFYPTLGWEADWEKSTTGFKQHSNLMEATRQRCSKAATGNSLKLKIYCFILFTPWNYSREFPKSQRERQRRRDSGFRGSRCRQRLFTFRFPLFSHAA